MSTKPAVRRRPRRVVPTPATIEAIRRQVADFERQFGTDSETMFEADPPGAAAIEETEDLHAWHYAWVHLQLLTGK